MFVNFTVLMTLINHMRSRGGQEGGGPGLDGGAGVLVAATAVAVLWATGQNRLVARALVARETSWLG